MVKPTWTVQDSIHVREQWEQFEDQKVAQLLYTLGTMPQQRLSMQIAENSDAFEFSRNLRAACGLRVCASTGSKESGVKLMARTSKSDEQTPLRPCTEHGDSLCYVHPVTQEHQPRFNCKCSEKSHPKCPVESHRHSARLDKC